MKRPPAPATARQRTVLDSTAMLLYTALVYGAGLTLFPLGRDFALMAQAGHGLPSPLDRLWAWEVHTFGAFAMGYHLVNLILLYACMACLYRLTQLTVKGPVWLGTLAATLFMANPVHSEAVLNLCGMLDLLPCLLALAAVTMYAASAETPRVWKSVLTPILFACAVLPFRQNAFLLAVPLCCEMFTVADTRRAVPRLFPLAVISACGGYMNAGILTWTHLDPARMVAPLYFVFYPLGFLPENAQAFAMRPWLGWVAAAAAAAVVYLIWHKAKRPAILFGLFSMAGIRLFQGGETVDPVHMIGGGQLLLANAFFNIAFVALCHRIMLHPKWHRPVVIITTLLCLVFFAVEIRSVLAWRLAAARVRAFQAEAAAIPEFGILPDYQYYRGAPMCLSSSIAHDTPFSKAHRAPSLLPLHYADSPTPDIVIEEWSPNRGMIAVRGARPFDCLCYPYDLMSAGATQDTPDVTLRTVAVEPKRMRIEIVPKSGTLPEHLAPRTTPR